MSVTVLILLMSVATLAIRLVPLAALSHVELPGWAQDWLSLVPGAVLAASLAQSLLVREGKLLLQLDNPHLLAALPAALVAWRTRNLILTMLTGMAGFALATRLLAIG